MRVLESEALPVYLWLVVLLELISPIPAFLTFGAIVVLTSRPPWFKELVDRLYATGEDSTD